MLLVRSAAGICYFYMGDMEVSLIRDVESASLIKVKYGEEISIFRPQEPYKILKFIKRLEDADSSLLYSLGDGLELRYQDTSGGCALTFTEEDGESTEVNIEDGLITVTRGSTPIPFAITPLNEVATNQRWVLGSEDDAILYSVDTEIVHTKTLILLIICAVYLLHIS